jgi:hypothetical protein
MRRKLSWAHVRAARFRRSARGRAAWLADDLTSGDRGRRDGDLDELPPLDRLLGLDTGGDGPRTGRPVLDRRVGIACNFVQREAEPCISESEQSSLSWQ